MKIIKTTPEKNCITNKDSALKGRSNPSKKTTKFTKEAKIKEGKTSLI